MERETFRHLGSCREGRVWVYGRDDATRETLNTYTPGTIRQWASKRTPVGLKINSQESVFDLAINIGWSCTALDAHQQKTAINYWLWGPLQRHLVMGVASIAASAVLAIEGYLSTFSLARQSERQTSWSSWQEYWLNSQKLWPQW